jgi:hypothetical protein
MEKDEGGIVWYRYLIYSYYWKNST